MQKVQAMIFGAAAMLCLGSVGGQRTAGNGTSVSGQVTILERPGETTEDFGDVVVYLDNAVTAKTRAVTPPTNTVMNLQGRQFVPRVRVVTQGSKVSFQNTDPFNHNVFSKMNGGFDTGVYGRGKTKDNVFADAGVYALYCNIHPRMSAFVVALSTPYYAQAEADGHFVIPNVPPGQYVLHVWHDRAAQVDQPVTVTATGPANLRVDLDARGYRYVQHKNKFGQDYTTASGDRY
jgi:plastocyanin